MAAVLKNVMFLDEEIYAQKQEYVIELRHFVRVYHTKNLKKSKFVQNAKFLWSSWSIVFF